MHIDWLARIILVGVNEQVTSGHVGSSNKEIAKSLNISDQTVKNHITSILKKLSVDDRTAAVVHALRHHWIALESSGARGDSEVSGVAESFAI